jgi:hypothetical protein
LEISQKNPIGYTYLGRYGVYKNILPYQISKNMAGIPKIKFEVEVPETIDKSFLESSVDSP